MKRPVTLALSTLFFVTTALGATYETATDICREFAGPVEDAAQGLLPLLDQLRTLDETEVITRLRGVHADVEANAFSRARAAREAAAARLDDYWAALQATAKLLRTCPQPID